MPMEQDQFKVSVDRDQLRAFLRVQLGDLTMSQRDCLYVLDSPGFTNPKVGEEDSYDGHRILRSSVTALNRRGLLTTDHNGCWKLSTIGEVYLEVITDDLLGIIELGRERLVSRRPNFAVVGGKSFFDK